MEQLLRNLKSKLILLQSIKHSFGFLRKIQTGLLLIFTLVNTVFAQTLIYTEPFDNTTNITVNPLGTFNYCNTSGTCGNNDIFNVSSAANIVNCLTGEVSSVFAMMDQDACDVDNNFIIVNMTVPAGNNGLIQFRGNFAALGDLLDVGDNFVVASSIDGGTVFTNQITFTRNSATTYSDGTVLTNTFSQRQFDLGSGLAGVTVKIRITFTTGGGTSEGAALDEFQLYHTPPACTEPTVQASNVTISNVLANTMDVSWTNGDGNAVLVVARATSSLLTNPTNGTSYTANTAFGSGTQIGTGNYVVYNSTGTSVSLTGLTAGVNYTISVYSYNTTGTCFLLPAANSNATTLTCTPPTVQATSVSFASVTQNSMTVSWTRGDGTNIMVVARATSSTLTDPTIGSSYTANATFGSGSQIGTGNFVVYSGTGTSVSVSGLSANVNYTFSVYEFNATGNCYMLAENNGNQTTLNCSAPSTQATSISFSSITGNAMTVSWTRGDGTNVLVVARLTSSVLTDPTNGVSYTANSTFGSGTQIGTGNYVVYSGTGTSVTVTSLLMGTNYSYAIYEFNSAGNCYLLTELSGSQSTIVTGNIYYVNDSYDSAQDIFCTAAGASGNNGLSPATPKATLKQIWNTYGPSGTNVLTAGDIIYIDAGTYTTDISIDITISGLSFIGAGITKTYFDRSASTALSTDWFMFIRASNTILKDFTVMGYENNGTQGPGPQSGQAITVYGSPSAVSGIVIDNINCFGNGQSGGNPSIDILSNSTVLIKNGGSFCNVWATAYTGGVGVYGTSVDLTIQDYIIAYNFKESSFDGGGLRIEGNATSFVTLRNVVFRNNVAVNGGAIAMFNGDLKAYDCVFDGNKVGQVSDPIRGGAVYISAGTAYFTRCQFTNNIENASGNFQGGAIACRYANDGDFSTAKTITLQVDSSTFSGNGGDNGTDIYGADGFGNNCNITIRDSRFSSGATNIVSDATSPANSINVTYIGTNPSSTGSNITKSASAATYTANPTVPTFGGDCTNIILPIELGVWNGIRMSKDVYLNWSTFSEKNNDFFSIERSLDGTYFQSVGSVKGNGSTQFSNYYKFTDVNVPNQTLYYRLVQKDFDGTAKVSSIIEINFNSQNAINFYPNPVASSLNIDFVSNSEEEVDVKVTDILGATVQQQNFNLIQKGYNHLNINLNTLPKGFYLIHFTQNGITSVKEVIKSE